MGTEPNNKSRAACGRAALEAYCKAKGYDPDDVDNDRDDTMRDFLTDVMHHVGLSCMEPAFKIAAQHWAEEVEEEKTR